jgi:hypothetical protein
MRQFDRCIGECPLSRSLLCDNQTTHLCNPMFGRDLWRRAPATQVPAPLSRWSRRNNNSGRGGKFARRARHDPGRERAVSMLAFLQRTRAARHVRLREFDRTCAPGSGDAPRFAWHQNPAYAARSCRVSELDPDKARPTNTSPVDPSRPSMRPIHHHLRIRAGLALSRSPRRAVHSFPFSAHRGVIHPESPVPASPRNLTTSERAQHAGKGHDPRPAGFLGCHARVAASCPSLPSLGRCGTPF